MKIIEIFGFAVAKKHLIPEKRAEFITNVGTYKNLYDNMFQIFNQIWLKLESTKFSFDRFEKKILPICVAILKGNVGKIPS